MRDTVEGFARNFIQEVATTRRGDIVRLIVAEGPRFPAIADFYYREVVSRGLAGMRALIELGIARGEIQQQEPGALSADPGGARDDRGDLAEPVRRHAPLDAIEMFRVHLDLIFGERRTT